MGRAVSAKARLADVVRGAERLSRQPMVCGVRRKIAGGLARGAGAAREESVSGSSSEIRAGGDLRLSILHLGGTSGNGGLVASGTAWRLPSAGRIPHDRVELGRPLTPAGPGSMLYRRRSAL